MQTKKCLHWEVSFLRIFKPVTGCRHSKQAQPERVRQKCLRHDEVRFTSCLFCNLHCFTQHPSFLAYLHSCLYLLSWYMYLKAFSDISKGGGARLEAS